MAAGARAEAMAKGLGRYFTGKPCRRGHVSERFTRKGICVACAREASLRDYYADPARAAEKARKFRESNPGYFEANRARINAASNRYRKRNPEKVAGWWTYHRAKRLQAVPSWFSPADAAAIARTRRIAAVMAEVTGEPWEVDHIIPLAGRNVCGLHVGGNVQAVPRAINRRKSNKFEPLESEVLA